MKVAIHNHLNDSMKTYEGDPASVERQIIEDYPWFKHFDDGDLETLCAYIDCQQMFSVEVLDDTEHPFLRE
jgi:hypothetical protein